MRTEDLLSLPTVCVGALSADGDAGQSGVCSVLNEICNADLSISHVFRPPCLRAIPCVHFFVPSRSVWGACMLFTRSTPGKSSFQSDLFKRTAHTTL
jgi:hypothetical protein